MASTLQTSCQQEHALAGAALEHVSLRGNPRIQISSLGLKRKERKRLKQQRWLARALVIYMG